MTGRRPLNIVSRSGVLWEEMGNFVPICMFRGATKVTLDSKGRVAIPVRHRDRLATRGEGQVVCTVDTDHCLLLYPLPDWEEIERKIMRLPSFEPKARRLQRLMVGYATEIELDANGRVLIPRELREFAGLEKTAMLIGQGGKLELWDEVRWNERREEWLAASAEDAAELTGDLQSLTI